jgi:hypothetical protein
MLRLSYLVLFTVFSFSQSTSSHSDQQSVIKAKSDLPIALDGTFQTRNTDHFSIISSLNPAEEKKIAYILELSYHHFNSLFKVHDFELRPPQDRLTWLTFTNTDSFNRYAVETEGCDLSWLTGYYSAGTNIVAMITPQKISKWQFKEQKSRNPDIIACPVDEQSSLVKLVHEAGHQLSFNTGLLKRKVMYPIWVSEGLAMFFERSLLSDYFHSCRYISLRSRRLARIYHSKQLIRLDEFISMSCVDEDACAIDIYAEAWGLFDFLCEHRRDSLKQYFLSLYELEPGYRSKQTLHDEFVRAFGPLDQIERQWTSYLESLSVL